MNERKSPTAAPWAFRVFNYAPYNPPVPINCQVRLDGKWARSFGPAQRMLRCDWPYDRTRLFDLCDCVQEWTNPLEALRWLDNNGRKESWVGYLSYDLGRWFETIPSRAKDDLKLPLFIFTSHDAEIVTPPPSPTLRGRGPLQSTFSRSEYESAVQRCINYITAGDIFQVNLSQRFTNRVNAKPQAVYSHLCAHAPADYGAILEYDDFSLVSNSPELFLKVASTRRVMTRPIKGTRPRGPGMEEELRNSSKEQAELNMIVDLERNDLGRVCEIGSVHVTEARTIEAHPTIYHGVATVEGILRHDIGLVDLLRATFPGGSITGAPKIRAMQIIEELEPVRRGPYCGAIGYIDSDGSMQFNMAIRTMIIKDGLAHIPVGGGIVADSIPSDEYEETLVKARAMFAALEVTSD
ncbi:MAG TPA: anthranilate synthase component I family protein [Tepidisphaeraceae bacterium]|nr:anthranilate synthase component I family protein [Tepidisphaeraceae bacterium]